MVTGALVRLYLGTRSTRPDPVLLVLGEGVDVEETHVGTSAPVGAAHLDDETHSLLGSTSTQ